MVLELSRFVHRLFRRSHDDGLATVELLGNAALAVLALVVIWGLVKEELAPQLLSFISDQITSQQ